MALSSSQIDTYYEEILARHATSAEQQAFVALSQTQSDDAIINDIATLPEASIYVDPVIRLYQGAFGRVPDSVDPNGNFDTGGQSGFWVNVNALRSGISLQGLAEAFVVSAEFQSLYGTSAVTPALITAYYQHILGRDPAASEVAAWQATGLDAANIMIGFTQSAEFIAKSQASVDGFKEALGHGEHPAGNLPPPPPDFTLTSDADLAGVNEGSTVTFVLQGPASAAGQSYSYNLTGSAADAADISGVPLSGTLVLDAQGVGKLSVTVTADHLTDGAKSLVLNVAGLTDQVAVNDTSLTPVVQNFTSTAGETLVGTSGNDVFQGVVDHSAFNDVGTFQNVVDVAQGGAGFDTLKLIVNQSNIAIVPNAPGVEELLVTDLSGSNYNLSMMPDVQVIASNGSTGGTMNFFNVQNVVNLDIENSDVGFANFNVTVTDAAGTGAVDVNLVNSGDYSLRYFNSDGDSVVTDWAIHAEGANNHIDNLHGAEITKTFTIDGGGSLQLDLDNSEDTSGVTSIDASALQGNFTLRDLHADQVDIEGSAGDNNLSMHALAGANVIVNTQGGDDTINVNSLSNANNNDQTFNISTAGGDDTVNINEQDGDNYNVTVDLGSGDNQAALNIGAAATIGVTAQDGDNNINIQVHDNPDGAPTFSASTVSVTVGDGANAVTVNTAADGGGSDQGSKITILAGNGANVINAVADDNALISVTAGNGGNTIIASGDAAAAVNVTTGSGDDNIQALTGIGAGEGTGSSITVNSGAGNDNVQVIWENAPAPIVNVNLGDGDDRVVLLNNQQVTANTHLDGGAGFDIFANDSAFYASPTILGEVKNFEALEVTNQLNNNVNAFDFPGSNISKVILDGGIGGDHTISGLNPGATVEVKGGYSSGADDLTVLVNNANLNIHDSLNVILNTNQNGIVELGGLSTPGVETLDITSTSQLAVKTGVVNNLELNNDLTTLNIHGDVTLDLNDQLFSVDTVNAQGFTGGLTLNVNLGNHAVTINAGDTLGATNILTANGADNVTLGNGTNVVSTLGGNDVIHLGSGQNTVTGGTGQDSISFAAHSATTIDTVVYNGANDSQFSLPDVITGFNQATDKIDLSFLPSNTAVHFAEVSSDAAVAATIASLNSGSNAANVVLNITTGHVFIDANSDGNLTTASDMEINLVGVNHLTAANFLNT